MKFTQENLVHLNEEILTSNQANNITFDTYTEELRLVSNIQLKNGFGCSFNDLHNYNIIPLLSYEHISEVTETPCAKALTLNALENINLYYRDVLERVPEFKIKFSINPEDLLGSYMTLRQLFGNIPENTYLRVNTSYNVSCFIKYENGEYDVIGNVCNKIFYISEIVTQKDYNLVNECYLKTLGNNYLVKINDEYNYYTPEGEFLNSADEQEWDWACNEWERDVVLGLPWKTQHIHSENI